MKQKHMITEKANEGKLDMDANVSVIPEQLELFEDSGSNIFHLEVEDNDEGKAAKAIRHFIENFSTKQGS